MYSEGTLNGISAGALGIGFHTEIFLVLFRVSGQYYGETGNSWPLPQYPCLLIIYDGTSLRITGRSVLSAPLVNDASLDLTTSMRQSRS